VCKTRRVPIGTKAIGEMILARYARAKARTRKEPQIQEDRLAQRDVIDMAKAKKARVE